MHRNGPATQEDSSKNRAETNISLRNAVFTMSSHWTETALSLEAARR
jgi:hypothetical protein